MGPVYSMFERPHHQRIHQVLQALNRSFLEHTRCYFGGDTAIVLALGEYRESVDIAFLCASAEGYRLLRTAVFESGLSKLFTHAPKQLREIRADRYGIRTVLLVEEMPIKFEIVREDRIQLAGKLDPRLGLPVLALEDRYCEKLLANTDRYADKAAANRDIIDLAMMIEAWGPIPRSAWIKARQAYGNSVDQAFEKACARLQQPDQLADCLKRLHMESTDFSQRIAQSLGLKIRVQQPNSNGPAP